MFPLASMPLSSDSSGNQNTKFIPAIDTPKIKMKTQNAYVRPDAGRGYLGDTRGLVGIRWWWCTKDHKNFKRGVEVLGKNSNEERREKEQGIYSAGKMKRSFPECQLPADAANCFDVTIRFCQFLCLDNK